jgi:hypothetical protein
VEEEEEEKLRFAVGSFFSGETIGMDMLANREVAISASLRLLTMTVVSGIDVNDDDDKVDKVEDGGGTEGT